MRSHLDSIARRHRRCPAACSGAKTGMTSDSYTVGRITAACAGWTLASYNLGLDTYTLTCPGHPDQVVAGEAFNDWVEQDDGTWRAPAQR